MGTATSTRTADRVERYRAHLETRYGSLYADTEQAELASVIESNALEALEAGEPIEAQVWTALGEIRIALRQRAWR